jgi:hypothetical protein
MLSLSYTQIWVLWERSPGLDSSSFEEEKINFNVIGGTGMIKEFI